MLLVALEVIDMVEAAYQYLETPEADWSKLMPLQADLVKWLESDNG